MICFNCPNCGRFYELPDALARLPLVCKQCGQRVTPPEVSTAPPPPPPSVPARPQAAPAAAIPVAKPAKPPTTPQAAPSTKPAEPPDDDVLVTKPDSTPEIDFNIGGPTAASLSDAARTRPAGLSNAEQSRPAEPAAPPPLAEPAKPQAAPEPEGVQINLDLLPKAAPPAPTSWRPKPAPEAPADTAEPTLLPFLADLGMFVLLVIVGIFLGEMLVGKSTGTVLTEASSAAKFPPVDLLMWAAPAVVFALIYLLLGKRERTLGAWLRRRRASSM